MAAQYDPYLNEIRSKKGADPAEIARQRAFERLLGIAALPLDMIRKGIDWNLETVEKYRLDDKAVWLYEEKLLKHGINPTFQEMNVVSGELDFVKLVGLKEELPYFDITGGVYWRADSFFITHAHFNMQKTSEIGPSWGVSFRHEDRSHEDFFGIGPHTSAGDRAGFDHTATEVGLNAGYTFSSTTVAEASFMFRDNDIEPGDDGGEDIIQRRYEPGAVPGLDGGEFLIYGLKLERDTRDFHEDTHFGSLTGISLQYHEGVNNTEFEFLKIKAEAAKFFEVFSERQVIALRVAGEHNVEFNKNGVPFYDMARLGGSGTRFSPGMTHRGFEENRFFGESLIALNLEYRYEVWRYRHCALNAVIFLDEGQVFGEWGEFNFKDFRESVGVGLRFRVLRKSIVSLEAARSDEGIELYAKTKTAF